MNAQDVAKEVLKSAQRRLALAEQIGAELKLERNLRNMCTHLKADGSDAIVQQTEGLFDFCTGCGKTF